VRPRHFGLAHARSISARIPGVKAPLALQHLSRHWRPRA
jgi:hypothetical protein